MYTTLPDEERDQTQQRPRRRAKRRKGRNNSPTLPLIFLAGIFAGMILVGGVMLLSRRVNLSVTQRQDGGFMVPYSGDAEVNDEASPDYALPAYQGDSSGLSIGFSAHSGEEFSATELYQHCYPSTVSLTVYAGKSAAYGSGMIVTSDGYLLTCAHVVADSQSCTVALTDGREFEAQLVGSDLPTDLAILKIDAKDLPAVEFFDSEKAEIGETVYAIGDPVRPEYRGTLTNGILSGVDRQVNSKNGVMRLLQITAPINSGNSGGPLFNAWGQVLGVVNMKLSRPDGGTSIENMGMAIPSRTVQSVVKELVTHGEVKRAVLGITCQPINQALSHIGGVPEGLWVTTIDEYSDCGAQGIQVGDIITAADGKEVSSVLQFRDIIEGRKPGDTVTLTVWRDEALLERLEEIKAAEEASGSAPPEAAAADPADGSGSTSEEEFEYHFHRLGDIQVKLVEAQ